ncbi:hypothetical protein TKK_0013306 [Trichogramma kaykai]
MAVEQNRHAHHLQKILDRLYLRFVSNALSHHTIWYDAGHDFITVEYHLKHQPLTRPPSLKRCLAAVTPETFGEALRPLLNDPTNHHALTCADDSAASLDTAVRTLTGFIVDAADAIAPLRPCTLSNSHRPRVNRGIRMLMD